MDITVRDLQNYLHHHYSRNPNEQSLFMKLIEEIGEVAEVLNMRAGRKAANAGNTQEQLATELADVIHYAVAIAAINHIDLTDTILRKDKKASVKYHHDTDLETFITNSLADEKTDL